MNLRPDLAQVRDALRCPFPPGDEDDAPPDSSWLGAVGPAREVRASILINYIDDLLGEGLPPAVGVRSWCTGLDR